ncbi:MAG TPA: class II glutamine amidotransferase [Pirellulales bacterium]|jgi:glutamine amidotransferase|nr:class II glutamine amidotransferase [Pirellulales bacterium]
MCRLIAMHADRVLPAAGPLADDPHALVVQSYRDLRGERHVDGWGIGHYTHGRPQIVRGLTPAFEDPQFLAAARAVRSRTVLGHIRQASVGSLSLENTHPFALGAWMFAHNGTVTGFSALEQQLATETAPDLLAKRRGSTDSELVFYWLLTRLLPAGAYAQRLATGLDATVIELGRALVLLDERSRRAAPQDTPRFNFLLTDGQVLLASRWNHSLEWRSTDRGNLGRSLLLASEPTSDSSEQDSWQELPDHSILAVNSDILTQVHSI